MKLNIKIDDIKKLIVPVGSILVLLLCLYAASVYSFLLFHTLSEIFSIAVVFAIFLIAWNARKFVEDHYLLFIGFSCFFVGILDLLHTLAYKGMPIFLDNDPDLATQLWICARFLQASSFLIAPFFIRRKMNPEAVLTSFILVFAAILAVVFYWQVFPTCFIEGQGLTSFKKNAEYLICLMFAAAIVMLYINRSYFTESTAAIIITSLFFMTVSELMFTGYITVTDPLNMAGHYLKIIAVFLLYRVLVKSQITNPFETMFRNFQQNEAVITKTLDAAKARTAEVTTLLDITTGILISQSFEESAASVLSKSMIISGGSSGYIVTCDDAASPNCRVVVTQGSSPFMNENSFIKFFTERYLKDSTAEVAIFGNSLNLSLVNGTVNNIISIPVVVDGRVSGWIVLLNKADDFTRNDLRILSSFSEMCAIALQSFEATRLLKESEQRFELFMDNVPACAYIKDSKGNYLFVNKCFEETFCSYDAVSRNMVIDPMPYKVAEDIKREDYLVLSTGRIIEENLVLPSKGEDKTFMIKKFPLKGDHGTSLIGGVAIDITEKNKFEENLRKEREKLDGILNSMENGVVIIGQDFEIKYANPAMLKTFGNVEGRKCYEYLCRIGEPCSDCDFTPILKGQSLHSEYFNSVNGRVYDSIENPYVDTATGEVCKLKMLWDITEVKKAQQEIRSLALFPSQNPHAVLRVLKDGKISYSNKPGDVLFGQWGVKAGDHVPDDWFVIVTNVLGSGKTIIKEMEIGNRVIAFTIKPLPADGYVNMYGRDITDYKNAQKALIKINSELEDRVQLRTRQLSEAVGALQGEVFERLAAEKGLLENQKKLRSLSQELVLSEERQRRKFAVELHDSIGQLLAFSKKELGTALDKGPENVQTVVRKVWQSIKNSIDMTRKLTFDLSSPTLYTLGLEIAVEEMAEEFSKEHNYRCELRGCKLPGVIPEDIQVLIFRSIRELLLNVAKHANALNVGILISTQDNIIKVIVEDDGVGFDVEEFLNNRVAVKSYGLFSVQESLTNFGGKLEIGRAADKGTRVVMYIPFTEQEGEKNEH